MLSLSKIKPAQGSSKNRKRVGRGNASGHGTYSTKGQKGQKSRSGVTGLKRLGMRQVLLRTPKKRGFTSMYEKPASITFTMINKVYRDGETISIATLKAKDLIQKNVDEAKILSTGELKIKNLSVNGVKISQGALSQIEKNGGKMVA